MAEVTTQKTYLSVPFTQKDEAKAAGALWDKKAKAWFAKGDVPDALKKFLSQNTPEQQREDPREAFAVFLRENGADLKGEPLMDGNWHRIALAGDGKARNASYRGFLDGVPNGQLKNFKGDAEPLKWTGQAYGLTANEKRQAVADAERSKAERAEQRAAAQGETAKRAFGIWANLPTWANVTNCSYLQKKQVRGFGVKRTDDGRMVVPMRDDTGRIWSLQFVSEDKKTFLKNGRKDGLYHTIDPDHTLDKKDRNSGDLTVIIGEGYATGAEVAKATKLPTIVAFDGDNLERVAKTVRAKFPSANILIAADDDHHLETRVPPLPNKGLQVAERAAAAVGGKVLAPDFTRDEKVRGLSDWNDLKQARGEDGLLKALRAAFKDLGREQTRGKSQGRTRELER